MKKAIIIIISLLVVLGGTFAILWFCTPLFKKSANENFSVQAKKLLGAKEQVTYNDYMDSIKNLKVENKSYTANANISMNVKLPSSILDTSTQNMLNATGIKWSGSYDADSKAMSNNIALSYNNKDTFNVSTIVNGKTLSIKSKDFYDKALSFDLSKLESFCKENNINASSEDIKKIEDMLYNGDNSKTANLIYDLFYLTEDEFNSINKNYGDLLNNLIDGDKYKTNKNQKVTVGGEEVKTTGYSLTLSGKDAYNYLKKLAERAKDDSNLKSIIIKKINLIKDLVPTDLGDSNVTIPDIKESDIEDLFGELIKAIEKSEDAFSSIKYSIRFTIYANKDNNPVRLDVALVKGEDDDGTVFFTEEVGNGKNTYTLDIQALMKKFSNSSNSSSDDIYALPSTSSMMENIPKIKIVDQYEKSDTSRKGTLTVSVDKQELAKVEYEFVSSKSESKINIKLSSEQLSSASLELKMEATGLDSDSQKFVFKIDGSIPYGYSTIKLNVDVDSSIEYGESDIEKLDDSNSVDVFSKSPVEIVNIAQDIVKKAADTLPSKLSNYGVRVTKDQILSILPTGQNSNDDFVVEDVDIDLPDDATEDVDPAA